jgi:hypothetical protein
MRSANKNKPASSLKPKQRDLLMKLIAFTASFLLAAATANAAIFAQTNWSGGSAANSASDPANLSGWLEFFSKDPSVDAGDSLTVNPSTGVVTQSDGVAFTPRLPYIRHNLESEFKAGSPMLNNAQINNSAVGLKPASMTPQWSPTLVSSFAVTGFSGANAPVNSKLTDVSADFADVDGDGDLDMFVGGWDGSSAYVVGYRNIGDEISPSWSYVPEWNISGGASGTRWTATPTLGDFDKDGLVDLFIGYRTTGSGFVGGYRNTGTATNPIFTYTSGWNLTTTVTTGEVANFHWADMADMNGDGQLDLMVGDGVNTGTRAVNAYIATAVTSTTAVWSKNSGTRWKSPALVAPATGPRPRVGDFNGDGALDILAAAGSATAGNGAAVNLFGYTNAGTAAAPSWPSNDFTVTNAATSLAGSTHDWLSLGDLDSDGDLDMMVSVSDGNATTTDAYPGNILYRYDNVGTIYNSSGSYTSTVLYIGDNDGFTTLNAVTHLPTGTELTIDVRAGNSTTAGDASWTAWHTDVYSKMAGAAADISGVEAKRYFQYRVNLSTGDTGKTPLLREITINFSPAPGGSNVAGDGKNIYLKTQSRAVAWAAKPAWDYTLAAAGTAAPGLGDFDGDGLTDMIVVKNGGITGWEKVKNSGSASGPVWGAPSIDYLAFNAGSTKPATDAVSTVPAFVDVDDDGDLDMFLGQNRATIYHNADAYENIGTASAPLWKRNSAWDLDDPALTTTTTPWRPTFTDLDGDGDKDAVIGINYHLNHKRSVFFFRNDRVGSTGAPVWTSMWGNAAWGIINTPGTSASKPAFMDIDGDGDMDMLVGGGGIIYGMENTGDTFTPGWTYRSDWNITTAQLPSLSGAIYPFVADMDNDGDLDLMVGMSSSQSKVYGIENSSATTYPASGAFNSSIIDFGVVDYGVMTYNANMRSGTGVTVQVRAGSTMLPDMTWSAWQTFASGASLSSLSGKRYLQYRVTLASDAGHTLSPEFQNITFNYSSMPASQELISSPFNTNVAGNYMMGISWSEILTTNSAVRLQLRTAPDNGGAPGAWTSWMGPDTTDASYWNSTNLFSGACSGSTTITCTWMPAVLKDGANDQWFQYKVIMIANGSAAPIVGDVNVSYASTLPPGMSPSKSVVVTSEANGANKSDSFTMALDAPPAAGKVVKLNVTVDRADEVSFSTASLTFNDSNWSTPQTVTVTGIDDYVDDGEAPYTITVAINGGGTTDTGYASVVSKAIMGNNLDDDTANITVTPTSGLITNEAGATSTAFTVALTSQPTASVIINLTSSDPTEGSVYPNTLTFTTSDWATPRSVTVTAVDEGIDDGDVAYNIVTAAAITSDAKYNGMNASDVEVTNIDNDSVGVTVTPLSAQRASSGGPSGGNTPLITTEAGGTASFTVVMNSQPLSNVTINYGSTNLSEGQLNGTLLFTSSNWNVPKTVTITGVDDSLADGDINYTIQHASTISGDPAYNGMALPDILVKNTDDDIAAIVAAPSSGLVTSEAGGTATFSVKLKTVISATVTLSLTSSNPGEGRVSPATLTFGGGSWGQAQSVTVTGVDDPTDDGDKAYTINITASGGDVVYNSLTTSVSLTNLDNDGASATDVGFSQSNWKAGVPGNSSQCSDANGVWLANDECGAVDPNNRSGWQAYKSKESGVSVINSGEDLELPVIEKRKLFTSSADFAAASGAVTHNRARSYSGGSFINTKTINSVVGLKPNTPATGAQAITTADWEEMPAWNFQYSYLNGVPDFADVDDDGDLDMIIGGRYRGGRIDVYRNDGSSIAAHDKSNWTLVPEWGFDWSADCCGGLPKVTLGDFDGDGDYDLFYADINTSGNSSKVRGYENVGTRTSPQWVAKSIWDLDTATVSGDQLDLNRLTPTLADINGDGKLEMMVGGTNSTNLGVGDDNSNQVIYGYSYDMQSSTWSTAPTLTTPNVQGTFTSTQRHTPQPSFGDLDNDGDLDLMIGWGCGSGCTTAPTISGFENEGNSTAPSWSFNLASPPLDTQSTGGDNLGQYTYDYVRLVDIDSDGDLDMITNSGNMSDTGSEATTGHRELVGYRNNSSVYPASGSYESALIDSGWANGFGVVSFNTVTPAGTGITVQLRAGNAASTAHASWTGWTTVNSGDDLSSLFAGKQYIQYKVSFTSDTTKTPLLKEITINFGAAYPSAANIITTHGALSLSMSRTVSWQYNSAWNHALPAADGTTPALGDLDGDGDTDMLVARSSQDGVNWFAVRNSGTTSAPVWEDLAASSSWVTGFDLSASSGYTHIGFASSLVDIDRDGDLDLFYSNEATVDGHVFAYENIGTAAQPEWKYNNSWALIDSRMGPNKTKRKPAFADLDDDGDADAATSIVWDGSTTCTAPTEACNIIMWRNNSYATTQPVWQYLPITQSPSWGVRNNYFSAYTINKPEFVDLDGDGDYDMLIGGPTNLIYAIENVGDKKFPSWQRHADWDVDLSAQGPGATPLPYAADLDNDGDMDLMLGSSAGAGTIYAYRNSSATTYAVNGAYTSNVLDMGSHLGFTTMSFNANQRSGTSLRVDVRSGSTATPDGGWTAWQTGVSSGVAKNILSHGANRYMQYRVYMESNGAHNLSPEVTGMTIKYLGVVDSAALVSSPYNTTAAANLITGLIWNETVVGSPSVNLQLRSAADNGGVPGAWSEWVGPDGTNNSYWNSVNTFAGGCSGVGLITCTTIPPVLRNGNGSQWLQYRVTLTSTGVAQPKLHDLSVLYATGVSGGISVTPTTGVTNESGTTATFNVSLNTFPSADVVIDVGSSDLTEGTVSPSTITFAAGNAGPIAVTVTGVNDSARDGNITYPVYTSAARSADANFNRHTVADVSITNNDNDLTTGGVLVTAPGSYTTSEAGASTSVSVVLASQPVADVLVTLESTDPTEGMLTSSADPTRTLSAVVLRFTSANWNVSQSVTIKGQDDALFDQDVIYQVVVSPSVSEDPNYSGINPADYTLTNTDNETATVIITADDPVKGFTMTEVGFVTFTAKLSAQPTANVKVFMRSSDSSEGVVSYPFAFGTLPTFTFTPSNWNRPQVGTFAGSKDNIKDGDVTYSIIIDPFVSTDPNFNGVNPPDITAVTKDVNGVYGIEVTPVSGLKTDEDGGSAIFKIRAKSRPTADVIIRLSSSDPTEGYVTTSVVLTPDDISVNGKQVTVYGLDDLINDPDQPYTIITATAESLDPNYNGVNPADVQLTNVSSNVKQVDAGQSAAHAGRAVAFADVNGDSYQDAIVGAPDYDYVFAGSGKVVVYLGNSNGQFSTVAQTLGGTELSGLFGFSVASAGDLNKDGNEDVIIGAPGEGVGGRAYVYLGSGSGLSATPSQTLDPGISGAHFGYSVAGAGKVNNDLYADVIVGAYSAGTGGRAYIYHGSAAGVNTTVAQTLTSGQAGANFGISVSGNIDINKDGYADVLVGADGYDGGQSAEGRLFAYYGSASGVSSSEAWYAESDQVNGYFGHSVTGLGDVNGDGYGDVAVGAWGYDNGQSDEGRVYLFYGPVTGPKASASLTLEANQASAYFGSAVGRAGDMNRDGYSDLVVGAPGFTNVESAEGRAYIYYGSASGMNTIVAQTLESDQANAHMGVAVAGGDFNRDGYSDLLIGADLYDSTQPDEGRAYLYRTPPQRPGVFFSQSELQTTEADGAGHTTTMSVVLTAPPTADVYLDISSGDTSEGTVSPGSYVVFTPINWKKEQVVTVAGKEDEIDDGDVSYNITTSVISGDGNYNNIAVSPVRVVNVNDDFSIFVKATDVSVGETGPNSGSFTFGRTGPTTSALTVNYSLSGTASSSDYTGLSGSVVIPAGASSVTAIVTPVDDAAIESAETIVVTLTSASGYLLGTPVSAEVTIVDNDGAGVTVAPVSGLMTNEAGGDASFTVVLNTAPSADVTIALSSSDATEGAVTPASLTFTPDNWSTAQSVTAVGVDDASVDGDVLYHIVTGATVSSDPGYNSLAVADVAVTNIDNDLLPNVSVMATTPSVYEYEESSSAMFTITRTGSTVSDLLVRYTIDGTATSIDDYHSVGVSVVIPAGSSSALVPILPVNDTVLEGDEHIVLTLVNDTAYIVANPDTAAVTINDDETPPLPVVNFTLDQFAGEGGAVTLKAVLSSDAHDYPVTVPYTVGGSAGNPSDHDAASGDIVISSGREGSVSFNVVNDGAGDPNETVIFTMGTPVNATVGARTTHTVTIVESNVAPKVMLAVVQATESRLLIINSDGTVVVTAAVTDPNPADTHTYNWSATNSSLVDVFDNDPSTFIFDPAGLVNGFYKVGVTVTDNGGASTQTELLLEVRSSAPVLSSTADSDGDGVNDSLEKFGDTDGDGIPDYMDASTLASHELQQFADYPKSFILRTDVGLNLRLGDIALAAGADGVSISQSDITSYGGGDATAAPNPALVQDSVPNVGGYYDFEISGLPKAGQAVRLVIPQQAALPAGAVYRKFNPNIGWSDFVVDADNSVASAPGLPGECPLPGDAAYTPGLTQGHYCVQLTINDGGANDQDGVANHVIVDPAEIGSVQVVEVVDNDSSASGAADSGGGVMRPDWLLMLMVLYGLWLRRNTRLRRRHSTGRC